MSRCLLCAALLLLWPELVRAGWDPLQKAERAAARGTRLLAEGDSLAAVNAFLEAQALAPDNPGIRNGLAEALYANGEYKSALGQYQSLAREAEPASTTQWDATYNSGNSAFAAGDYQGALDLYTQALLAGAEGADLRHNLELAQRLLEAAEKQQQQQDGEEGEQGEEQPEQDPQDGDQQQQQQQEEQEQQQEQDQEAQPDSTQTQEQQQSAAADSTQQQPEPAEAATDSLQSRMSVAEAMRLLDALDHDEEELRKSILRRLRGDTERAGDW